MYTIQSDIAIQVRQPLGANSRARLIDAAQAIPGVMRIHANPRASHLLMIDYDASRIGTGALRQRAHALGYSTSRIGR